MTGTDSMSARDHARRVEAALAQGRAARSAVVASWARSAHVHGLVPGRRVGDERMDLRELALLRERHARVIEAARPTLERLFQAVGGFGAGVMLADATGVPIERIGKPSEDADFQAAGLWTGTRWDEAHAGTNGIGTCIAEGRAVVIHRDQHFLSANTGLTCASAPVHDALGEMVAVIDVSTVRQVIGEGFAGLLAQTVSDAARRIEADLFHAHFPRARILMVSGPERALGALLAVDADDLVVGATRAARSHLGLSGDLGRAPVPVADLLGLDGHHDAREAERGVIQRALARSGGNVSAAARALGLSRATLHRKLGLSRATLHRKLGRSDQG